tara:strand:- start:437 stop:664 length:228 start_codon:yes stop_codon:yes gene_type:complete
MASYQIIDTTTNIVDNSVEWDGDTSKWRPDTGFVGVASTEGCIGWKYNSGGVGIGTTSGDTTKMWIPQIGYGTTI